MDHENTAACRTGMPGAETGNARALLPDPLRSPMRRCIGGVTEGLLLESAFALADSVLDHELHGEGDADGGPEQRLFGMRG